MDDLATLPGGARRTAPELGSTQEFNSRQQGVAGSKEHEFETSGPDYAIAEPVVVATCIPTVVDYLGTGSGGAFRFGNSGAVFKQELVDVSCVAFGTSHADDGHHFDD